MAQPSTFLMRWAPRVLLALALLPAVAVGGDYAVWAARGYPAGTATVNVFTVMELKGQKEDYGEPDVQQRTCSHRLFSVGGAPTCWSLARHPDVFERP